MEALETTTKSCYGEEEVLSTYDYPVEYKVRTIAQQVRRLQHFFPHLDYSSAEILGELPHEAEGWFVIPRWEKVATSYDAAVLTVLDHIASTRIFDNHREGKISGGYLCQDQKTVILEDMIRRGQGGDVLTIPAQFGYNHRGRSFRRTRETLSDFEFGLGTFAIGCMLLTHPERFTRFHQLYVYVLGDIYDPDRSERFLFSPIFSFSGSKLGFGAYYHGNTIEHYGSVTGFVPEYIAKNLLMNLRNSFLR